MAEKANYFYPLKHFSVIVLIIFKNEILIYLIPKSIFMCSLFFKHGLSKKYINYKFILRKINN